MPTTKLMLRLLSLGACAEMVLSFGTMPGTDEVSLGTESAGASLCPCKSRPQCRASGPQSLTSAGSPSYVDTTLVRLVTNCYDLCYKAGAPYFTGCGGETGADLFVTDMCSADDIISRLTTTSSTLPNPFKDGSINCAEASDDDARTRCAPITAEGSIYFTESTCQQGMRAKRPTTSVADSEATCNAIYKYSCSITGTRLATFCTYDTSDNRCRTKFNDDGSATTRAAECQGELCGIPGFGASPGTPGIRADDPACLIAMPQCRV